MQYPGISFISYHGSGLARVNENAVDYAGAEGTSALWD